MIGALNGTIESINETNNSVLVMTHGVGYEVFVPHANILTIRQTITLYTYLAVRETALDLYGFTSNADKDLFQILLKVPKIGPKSGLDVLSKSEPAFLLECIQTEDPSRLHKLSGIGKKTCENIVTNLHDKVTHLAPMSTNTGVPTNNFTTTEHDAVDALVSLGYDPRTAREKITQFSDDPTLSVSDLVARALK